jgi:predicted AAA+ superfamily ATPase
LISKNTGISVNVVKKYLLILENMFLIKKLYPLKAHITSNIKTLTLPKIYFFDPALAVAILNSNSDDLLTKTSNFLSNHTSNLQDCGFLFEANVIKHLRIYSEMLEGSIYYYRDVNKNEVDAIIQYGNKYAVFEIKIGSRFSIEHGIKTLSNFKKIISKEFLDKCTTFNIIVAGNLTYFDKINNINIISFRDLYLEI